MRRIQPAARKPDFGAMKRLLRGMRGPFVGAVYLLGERVTMGRAADADIQLPHPEVSRSHAKITRQSDGGYVLLDLGSDNGTLVGDELVERRVLQVGDKIRIHEAIFEFCEGTGSEQTSLVFHRRIRSFDVMRQTVVSSGRRSRPESTFVEPSRDIVSGSVVRGELDVIVQDVADLEAGRTSPGVPEVVGVPTAVIDDGHDLANFSPRVAGSLSSPTRDLPVGDSPVFVPPPLNGALSAVLPLDAMGGMDSSLGFVAGESQLEGLLIVDDDDETEALRLFYTPDDDDLGAAPSSPVPGLQIPAGGLVAPSLPEVEEEKPPVRWLAATTSSLGFDDARARLATLRPVSLDEPLPPALGGVPFARDHHGEGVLADRWSSYSRVSSADSGPRPQLREERFAPHATEGPIPIPADELPTRQILVTDLLREAPSGTTVVGDATAPEAEEALPYAPNYEPPPGYREPTVRASIRAGWGTFGPLRGADVEFGARSPRVGRSSNVDDEFSFEHDSLELVLDQSIEADGRLGLRLSEAGPPEDEATPRYAMALSPLFSVGERPGVRVPERTSEAISDEHALIVLRQILDYRSLRIRQVESDAFGREDEVQLELLDRGLHRVAVGSLRREERHFRPVGRMLKTYLTHRGSASATTIAVVLDDLSVSEAAVRFSNAAPVFAGDVVWLAIDLSSLHMSARSIVFKARVAWVHEPSKQAGLLFAGPAQYVERPEEATSGR